jgi:RNA polymerase-binding transcription factor DksA
MGRYPQRVEKSTHGMSSAEIFQLLEQKLRARRGDLTARTGQASNEERSGELLLVEAAIARFESGDYGVCCLCFESLELERLQRDPVMQFCAACADAAHGDNIV